MKTLQKQTWLWPKAWCQSGFRGLLDDYAGLNSLRARLVHVLAQVLFLSAIEFSQDNFVPITIAKPIPRWDVHSGILKTTERTPRLVISPLVANRVGIDSAILRYVHFTLALV